MNWDNFDNVEDFLEFYEGFLSTKLSCDHSLRRESEDYFLLVLACYLVHSCKLELSAIKEILSSLDK